MTETNDTSLARRTDAEITITKPIEFRAAVSSYREQRFNVLTPVVDVGALPPQWSLVPSIVQIDVNPKNGEVYQDRLFCDDDEVALAKPALRRVLDAAGISVHTERVDPRTIQFYWEFRCTLTYRGFDGKLKTREATADYDLRDGSPRVEKMRKAAARKNKSADDQISAARMFGLRGCEARAVNAAAREMGLKQKYKIAELSKPFVLFVPVFTPDPTNVEQMRMVTADALANSALLYPVGGPAALPEPASHAHPDAIDVDPETGEIVSQERTDAPLEDPPAAKKAPGYTVTGVNRSSDGRFNVLTKETDNTRIWTDDLQTAQAAKAAMQRGTPVQMQLEQRGAETWILELTAGEAPL